MSSYKNQLQDFAQRSNIRFPIYHSTIVPQLIRCSVEVDGETYTILSTCVTKKEAEQEAAKVALEAISKKIEDSVPKNTNEAGFPPISQSVSKNDVLEGAAQTGDVIMSEVPKGDSDAQPMDEFRKPVVDSFSQGTDHVQMNRKRKRSKKKAKTNSIETQVCELPLSQETPYSVDK